MSVQVVTATPPAAQDAWARVMAAAAAEPLEFCPRFPQLAARYESWWAHEAPDRPILIAHAARDPDRQAGRRLELLDDPDRWIEAKIADVINTDCLADALPWARVDFGPACMSGMLGGERVIESDTAWTEPFIDDEWSNAPDFKLRDDNLWYRRLRDLTELLAESARGRFLVGGPDLGGASDALLSMRGSVGLCMDAVTQPDKVRSAMDAMYPAWVEVCSAFYQRCADGGVGALFWLGLWSTRPYTTLTCDYNYMLGPDQFREVCLPDIQRACQTFDRSIIHVDGPQAVKHIATLCELGELDAIQYTPGAGSPSPLTHVAELRAAQDAGKSLLVMCPAHEAIALAEQLRPEGLAIWLETGTPDEKTHAIDHLHRNSN